MAGGEVEGKVSMDAGSSMTARALPPRDSSSSRFAPVGAGGRTKETIIDRQVDPPVILRPGEASSFRIEGHIALPSIRWYRSP